MIQYINGARIANAIRMSNRFRTTESYLIVEGHSDFLLFSKFVTEKCKIEIANGKDDVIYVIQELNKANIKGILGIVDKDFGAILGYKDYDDNILSTDTHDIEIMMIQTSSLENIILEYADKIKFSNFLKIVNLSLREALLNSASPIGYLRLLSIIENMKLSFDELPFETFMNMKNLNISIENLIRTVLVNSHNCKKSLIDVKKSFEALSKNKYDSWHLCCGHDITEILAICLANIFGLPKCKNFNSSVVETSLRLSYQYTDFIKTELYEAIRKWENINDPFRVLKQLQQVAV